MLLAVLYTLVYIILQTYCKYTLTQENEDNIRKTYEPKFNSNQTLLTGKYTNNIFVKQYYSVKIVLKSWSDLNLL